VQGYAHIVPNRGTVLNFLEDYLVFEFFFFIFALSTKVVGWLGG